MILRAINCLGLGAISYICRFDHGWVFAFDMLGIALTSGYLIFFADAWTRHSNTEGKQ